MLRKKSFSKRRSSRTSFSMSAAMFALTTSTRTTCSATDDTERKPQYPTPAVLTTNTTRVANARPNRLPSDIEDSIFGTLHGCVAKKTTDVDDERDAPIPEDSGTGQAGDLI